MKDGREKRREVGREKGREVEMEEEGRKDP